MIYAVNKRTKEHRLCKDSHRNIAEWGGWEIVEANPDGWIPWDGGECPLPDGAAHEVKWRDESITDDDSPETWDWNCGIEEIIAYRPVLDAGEPEPPAWDGEGLPPVGAECEVLSTDPDNDDWRVCKILAHTEMPGPTRTVVVYQIGDQIDYLMPEFFRPVRSEEDKAVEAMADIFSQLPMNATNQSDLASYLYSAIRDGKVPGVKLTGGE